MGQVEDFSFLENFSTTSLANVINRVTIPPTTGMVAYLGSRLERPFLTFY
jgi:hypothetical protein